MVPPRLNFAILEVDIPSGHEEEIWGTIAIDSPIYVREKNVEIKVTGRESDGIAANGELTFCQVYDTRSEGLRGVDR